MGSLFCIPANGFIGCCANDWLLLFPKAKALLLPLFMEENELEGICPFPLNVRLLLGTKGSFDEGVNPKEGPLVFEGP